MRAPRAAAAHDSPFGEESSILDVELPLVEHQVAFALHPMLRAWREQDARDVLRLEDEAPARTQRVVELSQDRLVLLVREVAEAREPVDDGVEAPAPRHLAHVAFHVIDVEPLRVRFGSGLLEKQLARVEARNVEAAGGQRVRDAAVPAWAVEYVGAALQLEQAHDAVHVRLRPLAKHRLVEVEVVLLEDAREIELAHSPRSPNRSSSMWISPTRSNPSRSRIGRDIEPPCVTSAGVPFATASCQRAWRTARYAPRPRAEGRVAPP